GRRRNRLAKTRAHHHWVGEVHHVDSHRVLLLPHRHVEHARPDHGDWPLLIEGPVDRITQQPSVIVHHHLPVDAVDIPGKVDHASLAEAAQEDPWLVDRVYWEVM